MLPIVLLHTPMAHSQDRASTASAPPHTEGKTIRWARLYDVATALLSFGRASILRRTIVELAHVAPGERIPDVGCGPGPAVRHAMRAGCDAPKGKPCVSIVSSWQMISARPDVALLNDVLTADLTDFMRD